MSSRVFLWDTMNNTAESWNLIERVVKLESFSSEVAYVKAGRFILRRRWRVYADQLQNWEFHMKLCSCDSCRMQCELRLDYDTNGWRKHHGDEEG